MNGVDEGKNQQHQQKKKGGGGGKHNVGEGGEMRRKLGNSKKGGKEKWEGVVGGAQGEEVEGGEAKK